MQLPPEDLEKIDRRATHVMEQSAIPMLRIAVGITYLWFGLLKVFGVSPVSDLVGKMSFGLPKGFFVKMMGIWETALGVALLFRLALRFTLLLYFVQLAGTFTVFIAHPRETFRSGNPLLLTRTGEFIVKNLVLLAAGVAVGSTARHDREDIRVPSEHTIGQAPEVHVGRGE
jgi:uncharacterized membrane protein YphA (DoxX/SURF4 family)